METWWMHDFMGQRRDQSLLVPEMWVQGWEVGGRVEWIWHAEEMAGQVGRQVHWVIRSSQLVNILRIMTVKFLIVEESIYKYGMGDGEKKPWGVGLEPEMLAWISILKCDIQITQNNSYRCMSMCMCVYIHGTWDPHSICRGVLEAMTPQQ